MTATPQGAWTGLTRRELVKRLAEERDPQVLGGFIHHPAWQVRWEAITSLGKTGSPAAEAFLLEVLATTDDSSDLVNANAALSKVGSRAAIPALTPFIHHRVEDVKCSAINAIGVLGDSSLTPLYLDALTDRSSGAKAYAMAAIHRNGDDRAIAAVVDRVRQVLGRERKTRIGGWSEVMYGLDFLRPRQDVDPRARATIEWVRSSRLAYLQAGEREWFESTIGIPAGDSPG